MNTQVAPVANLTGTVATVSNRQTRVTGTGLATHGRHVVYLGVVGNKTSLKSIWATLVKAKGGDITAFWTYYLRRLTKTKYVQLWTPLPETTANHLQLIADTAVAQQEDQAGRLMEAGAYILAFDPKGARFAERYSHQFGDARGEMRQAAVPELQQALVYRLNQMLPIPVLPEWAPYLWGKALEGRHEWECGLQPLTTNGDCVGGHWIDPGWNWTGTIREGLKQGQIGF